jgi:DICT domain-containing protein
MTAPPEPSSLTEFVDRRSSSDWSIRLINRTAPDPVERMVEELFDGLSIGVLETERADAEDDLLLLLRDGEVVESSSVDRLERTLLMVNADLYSTGTRSLEDIDPPDVITELSDTVFTLQGYPQSNTEKLVLVLMSRYIEHRAWSHQRGTLRASFQRLSRLDDESGTREVYERLGDTAGLTTHVYGVPNWEPPAEMGLEVHGVTSPEITDHWFVVHRTDDAAGVAMVAVVTEGNEWRGFWTFDPDDIRTIDRYIQQAF